MWIEKGQGLFNLDTETSFTFVRNNKGYRLTFYTGNHKLFIAEYYTEPEALAAWSKLKALLEVKEL